MTRDERGVALGLAILALVVLGALVAGTFVAATEEQRAGENAHRARRALALADAGIGAQLAEWDPVVHNAQPTFPAGVRIVERRGDAGGTVEGRVLKLNRTLYLIDVTASDSTGRARQRVGLIARVRPIAFDLRAALTAVHGGRLEGPVRVAGADGPPPGWSCDPADSSRGGMRSARPIALAGGVTASGDPPAALDSTLGDAALTQFGDEGFDELAARAAIRLPGGSLVTEPRVSAGRCDRADPRNWGDGLDPGGPCGDHFPIIHIAGNARLVGGQGQGVLLVDGDLTVAGGYRFFGVVVIRGRLDAEGPLPGGVGLWGAVLAQRVRVVGSGSDGFEMRYSKCAIGRALQMTGRLAPLASRSWGQLF